jgi:hypothetical protein
MAALTFCVQHGGRLVLVNVESGAAVMLRALHKADFTITLEHWCFGHLKYRIVRNADGVLVRWLAITRRVAFEISPPPSIGSLSARAR